MARVPIRTVTVVLILYSIASPAPAPLARPGDGKPNLFPLAKGAKWEYRRTFVGQNGLQSGWTINGTHVKTAVVRVGGVAVGDGPTTVTFTGDFELIGFPERMLLTRESVSCRGEEVGGDKPLELIRNSVKAGEQWDSLTPFGCGGFAKAKATVGGKEVVEVLAGRFEAVKVTYMGSVWGGKSTLQVWYADRVGVVKRVWDPDSRSPMVTELVKYTSGE